VFDLRFSAFICGGKVGMAASKFLIRHPRTGLYFALEPGGRRYWSPLQGDAHRFASQAAARATMTDLEQQAPGEGRLVVKETQV
jgi:hypothetical protein